MKAVVIEDIGVSYVLLSSGKYLVGDRCVTIDSYYDKKVQVNDGDVIRKITETTVIVKYVKGEEEMSVEEYNYKKDELLKHSGYDDYNECNTWEDLDKEYEYKKLINYWTPVRKMIQEFSEPLIVSEINNIKYKTGNEFIKNLFLNGDSKEDATLYVYNRPEARIHIVSKIFNDLGFEYKKGASYGATKDSKIWGNSDTGSIRYVTAFGTYIFDDSWGNSSTPRGLLEDMKKLYDEDYDRINKIIMPRYNKVFGKIDKESFDFVGLIDNLVSLKSSINSIDSKIKTQGYQNKAIYKLNGMIEEINRLFK